MNYITLRNQFLPKKIKTVFIAESPPAKKGYIYDLNGKPSELFFRSMMRCVLDKKFDTKQEGLEAFQQAGYLIINPIYTPVNKLPDKVADQMILEQYPYFVKDLLSLIDKDTPIILIKKNICTLLEPKLKEDGFTVLNNGVMVPFPMHYHYNNFEKKVRKMLESI